MAAAAPGTTAKGGPPARGRATPAAAWPPREGSVARQELPAGELGRAQPRLRLPPPPSPPVGAAAAADLRRAAPKPPRPAAASRRDTQTGAVVGGRQPMDAPPVPCRRHHGGGRCRRDRRYRGSRHRCHHQSHRCRRSCRHCQMGTTLPAIHHRRCRRHRCRHLCVALQPMASCFHCIGWREGDGKWWWGEEDEEDAVLSRRFWTVGTSAGSSVGGRGWAEEIAHGRQLDWRTGGRRGAGLLSTPVGWPLSVSGAA